MDFIYGREIVSADASVSVLVSFLACIQQRRSASNAPVTSLKFVAGILGWDKLLSCLANPVVAAWTGSYGQKEARKEALPLPLSAVANFERKVLESMGQEEGLDGDGLLTVAFLIMIWAALRFSDAQRVSVNEMDIVEGILRCCCWRTKSSRTPMPWGCLTVGVCGDWTPAVALLRQRLGDADFMIPGPSGDRASFTFALSQLRRLLVSVGKLPVEAVGVYTLHSLKVTGLSWGVQVDIDSVWQRLWGHHRSRDSGEAMAQKYGREDVLPALRGQLAVVQAIRGGWVPLTPQVRGARRPVPECRLAFKTAKLEIIPMGLSAAERSEDDTDAESESDGSTISSCSSSVSEEMEAEDACCDEEDDQISRGQLLQDMYVVNCLSARFHAAVILDCGVVRRACAPSKDIDDLHWQVWKEDPSLKATPFEPCNHLACAQVLCGGSGA